MEEKKVLEIVERCGIRDTNTQSLMADLLRKKTDGDPIVVTRFGSLKCSSRLCVEDVKDLFKSLSLMGLVYTKGLDQVTPSNYAQELTNFVTVDLEDFTPKVATPLSDDVLLLFTNAEDVEVKKVRDVVSIRVKSKGEK